MSQIFGIGTYRLDSETTYQIVKKGLEIGYRLIDTAQLYQNESAVGNAIRDSDLSREELFIVTKVHHDLLEQADRQEIIKSIENSLEQLGKIDLLLLHDPTRALENWTILEDIYSENSKIKQIGVSNFSQSDLQLILTKGRIKPTVNQIELSPFCPRAKLVQFCQDQKIQVMAHSSLIKGVMFDHPKIIQLAAKYQINPSILLLQWGLSKNYTVLPRTSNEQHLLENWEGLHGEINPLMIEELDQITDVFVTHSQFPIY